MDPINFVSVRDVAALVERAVVDPGLRGKTISIGGPENLSFSDVASAIDMRSGAKGSWRHVPLPMMRAMSWVMRPFAPAFARQVRQVRQVRAGVVLDTEPYTFAEGRAARAADVAARRATGGYARS